MNFSSPHPLNFHVTSWIFILVRPQPLKVADTHSEWMFTQIPGDHRPVRSISSRSCSPDSVWLEVLVVFYSCVDWVQSNICTKASYLVSTLHLFCAGQNHNVMCKKNLRMNFLVTRFFLSMSLECVSRTSLTGIFRVVRAPAHLLCFAYSLGQACSVSWFKWFSFQSSNLRYQNVRFLNEFFSPRNFFPPFLEQIWPFHVCGLPCWLFPLLQRAKNLSDSTLSLVILSSAEIQSQE